MFIILSLLKQRGFLAMLDIVSQLDSPIVPYLIIRAWTGCHFKTFIRPPNQHSTDELL